MKLRNIQLDSFICKNAIQAWMIASVFFSFSVFLGVVILFFSQYDYLDKIPYIIKFTLIVLICLVLLYIGFLAILYYLVISRYEKLAYFIEEMLDIQLHNKKYE